MTYSAIAVARMPNIQISIDAQSLSPLTGAIATFNGYLATPSTHSTFTGELNSQFVAQSNTIQVLKKTLVLCNLRAKDPQFVSSDHITSFGIYDQSTNTLLSQQADNKQWTFSGNSGTRSQYFTTKYSCQTAYAIVDANTTLQFKVIGTSAESNIDASSHIILFQLEA